MEKHLYAEHFELESKHGWFVSKKRIILSFVEAYLNKNKKDLTILDAGCGAGLMLKDLQTYGKTFGMDYSEDAVKFSSMGFDGEVRRGWLPDNVPYEGKKFDLIICLDVIEHIDDDKKSLEKIRDLLSENGVLILTVPALMFLWSKWDDLNHHKRRYNRKQLYDVMTQAGFQLNKISYYNSLLFLPIAAVRLLKNALNNDSDKSDTDMPSPPVNFILKGIFSLEKFLLKIFNFPIGVSLIAVAKKNSNKTV
jgi:SAM-dependent methyltransferase